MRRPWSESYVDWAQRIGPFSSARAWCRYQGRYRAEPVNKQSHCLVYTLIYSSLPVATVLFTSSRYGYFQVK